MHSAYICDYKILIIATQGNCEKINFSPYLEFLVWPQKAGLCDAIEKQQSVSNSVLCIARLPKYVQCIKHYKDKTAGKDMTS